MALLELNFESSYLKCNHAVSVILPDRTRKVPPAEFYRCGEKYKVLWLLHGTYGDHTDWVRKTNIELYACERNLVVVMPSGLNANYANWPDFSIGYNMYDYFLHELMPLVYGWLPVSDKREDNFIAGLSMGGTGAALYAANHPERFAGAAILSNAPRDMETVVGRQTPDYSDRIKGIMENAGGLKAYLESYENVWGLLTRQAGQGVLPRLYFCIGTEDFGYANFQNFKAHAQKIGLDAVFEEEPGYAHEWRFWDRYIQKSLDFFGIPNANGGNAY